METNFKLNQITVDQIKTQSVDVYLLHQELSKFTKKDQNSFQMTLFKQHTILRKIFPVEVFFFPHFLCITQDFFLIHLGQGGEGKGMHY